MGMIFGCDGDGFMWVCWFEHQVFGLLCGGGQVCCSISKQKSKKHLMRLDVIPCQKCDEIGLGFST